MRTIGSPSQSPRIRPAALGTSALVAAGLVLGVVGTAAAQNPIPHTIAAKTVAVEKTGGNPIHAVAGNLLATPYFENRLWPWVGTSVTRVERPLAPSGRLVARVGSKNGKASIDNWPGEVHSVAGAKYTGTVKTRAVGASSNNKTLTLVIREHTPGGTYVGSASQSLMMNYWFRGVTVSYTAKHTGDIIDLYAFQADHVWSTSAFYVDDFSLVATKPSTPTPPTPPTPPTNPNPPTGNAPSTVGLLAYATGQPTRLGDTSKYAYVVVQENQFSAIAAIKRMNPNTKVLAYMNTSADNRTNCATNSSSPHLWGASYGINYCWVNKYHPDWFLTDRSGNRMHFSDYPFAMQLDMNNPTFAASWAAGVYNNAKHDGFDGIWIDDLNIDPGHGMNNRFAKYTDEQFASATANWGSRVGDYLRSRGMTVFGNVGMQPWIQYRLDATIRMAAHLTGVNREHFVRYGDICGPFGERFNNTANNGTPPLSSFINYTNKLQAQGTKFSGVDYGFSSSSSDDLKAMTYGRALFLLSWNGTAGSAYFFRKCGVNDTALPQWTTSLGLPAGPIQTLSNGVMTRKFQGGMVVLNPNRGGSSAKVSIPTGLHTMSGADADGGVYVAPQTAAILSS